MKYGCHITLGGVGFKELVILKARVAKEYHIGWEEMNRIDIEVFMVLIDDMVSGMVGD